MAQLPRREAQVELGGTPETLQVPVTANVPVTIFVDGYAPGEEGPYTLTVTFMP